MYGMVVTTRINFCNTFFQLLRRLEIAVLIFISCPALPQWSGMVGRIIHNDTLKKCSRIWDLDSITSKTKSRCKLTSVIIERNEKVQITQNNFDIFVTK